MIGVDICREAVASAHRSPSNQQRADPVLSLGGRALGAEVVAIESAVGECRRDDLDGCVQVAGDVEGREWVFGFGIA